MPLPQYAGTPASGSCCAKEKPPFWLAWPLSKKDFYVRQDCQLVWCSSGHPANTWPQAGPWSEALAYSARTMVLWPDTVPMDPRTEEGADGYMQLPSGLPVTEYAHTVMTHTD